MLGMPPGGQNQTLNSHVKRSHEISRGILHDPMQQELTLRQTSKPVVSITSIATIIEYQLIALSKPANLEQMFLL